MINSNTHLNAVDTKIKQPVGQTSLSKEIVPQTLQINSLETVQSGDPPLQMTIKVVNAANIKGSKGEHVNSMIRSQFADFDFKDSTVFADNANPEYNLSYEHSFVVDEVFSMLHLPRL
jgi:hypothetical protein